jgi:shikimate kinase
MEFMNAAGDTVYIQLSAEDLFKRLHRKKQDRPLLNTVSTDDLLTRIREMLSQREGFYRQAKYVLPTGGLNKEESLILFRKIYLQPPTSPV